MKKYYKFYNKDGKRAYIKVAKFLNLDNVIIKFQRQRDEDWLYHTPNKKFKNVVEIINFIVENLENDKTYFNVV